MSYSYKTLLITIMIVFSMCVTAQEERAVVLDFIGHVKYKHEVSIVSPVRGVVASVDAVLGELVKVQDTLAKIENLDAEYLPVLLKGKVDGYKVVRIEKFPGEPIDAHEVVLFLASPNEFLVEFSLNSKDLSFVSQGEKARISLVRKNENGQFSRISFQGVIIGVQAPASHTRPFWSGIVEVDCSNNFVDRCNSHLVKGALVNVSLLIKQVPGS